jgi:hypothetical protein
VLLLLVQFDIVIRGDTLVTCCPSFVHTFFYGLPSLLYWCLYHSFLSSVSGGHVSALEITFQKLFSADIFCILLKITHFKLIGPNHFGRVEQFIHLALV